MPIPPSGLQGELKWQLEMAPPHGYGLPLAPSDTFTLEVRFRALAPGSTRDCAPPALFSPAARILIQRRRRRLAERPTCRILFRMARGRAKPKAERGPFRPDLSEGRGG